MKIGFVGLGGIGVEMVKRLLAAGHDVTIYARGAGLAEAEAAGAKSIKDYQAVAAGCDALVMCVFKDAQLREVMLDHGALAAMRPGSVLVNHTTGSPDLIRELADKSPEDVEVLDATFSGGPEDVARGALTLMVGGAESTLAKVKPALDAYCSQTFVVGEIGSAQIVKLLNNLLFATNLMNAGELLTMAEAQGMDINAVAKVIHAASGQSYGMDLFRRSPTVADMMDRAQPYAEKDVAAALSAARDAGFDASFFQKTEDYFLARRK